MSARASGTLPRRLLAIVAVVFGLVTVVAGMRALGGAVAIDSLAAMTFRTGVWLALFLGLAWLKRGRTFWKVRSQ